MCAVTPHELTAQELRGPLDWALFYSCLGWYVFPCHTMARDGCTCGRSVCTDIAKHPLTKHGLKDATRDERQISEWWEQWPGANVAVATEPSGLVVIDLDPNKGGLETWSRLVLDYGPELHCTWQARTGSGGRHLIFHAPAGVLIRNSTGRLGPGIDVRAAGGYFIAPPSLHKSGNRYEWLTDWS